MKKYFPMYLLFFLAVSFLAGCATATAPGEEPAAVVEQPQATLVATQPATAQPTAASVDSVDYCVECHTDKEMLINTAKPEEEAGESESKGTG